MVTRERLDSTTPEEMPLGQVTGSLKSMEEEEEGGGEAQVN